VAFGENADRLLDAHPGRQGVLELRDRNRQALRLSGLAQLVGQAGAARGRDPVWPGDVRPGCRGRGMCGLAWRAVLVNGFHQTCLVVGRLIGREQVGEHHRAGQVGDVLVTDDPAMLGLPHDHVLVVVILCLIHPHTRLPPHAPLSQGPHSE